ncbi:hypothetical protein BLA29_003260 [Euroglyphus maynei]|uniref:Uncharacterized protein n=1 Tax=Euroglyphus maynei TaxID=6958 RepID=A0A1Y3BJQ8_EURMA|nr:hypothetical protein BLA29_003260 [Euroglyphus maynei]
MEVLPLILLLTMGVIISTTCAKYRFQSSPSPSPLSSIAHHDYLKNNSETSSIINDNPSKNDEIINNNDDEYMMDRMMNDEESPSIHQQQTSEQRPYYSLFQNGQQQQQQKSKSTNLAGTSQQQQQQQQLFAQLAHQYSAMHLQWLTNSSVTCNDGTRAGYYIRPSPTGSKRWIIFLEGGWYCMSKTACDQRWYKMRDFMTSFRWSQYKTGKCFVCFRFVKKQNE